MTTEAQHEVAAEESAAPTEAFIDAPPTAEPAPKKEKGFRNKVKMSMDKNDTRPSIRLPGAEGELSPFFTALGGLLKDRGVYQKNDAIAVAEVAAGKAKLRFPNAVALPEVLEGHVRIVKLSKAKEEVESDGVKVVDGKVEPCKVKAAATKMVESRVSLPDRMAKKALESANLRAGLREIRTVEQVRLPVERGGKLEKLPAGYNAGSMVYSADSVCYRTDMPVAEARAFLGSFFGEFNFADSGRSKAILIALAVSEFAKYLLPVGVLRPAVISQANAPGGGKTIALQMGLGAVHGFTGATPYPRLGEEMRKKVAGVFASGSRILLLDNAEGFLNSDVLCGVITSPIWQDRILGTTGQASWRHESQICISGNNVRVGPDLLRRSLVVDIRQTAERPELRRAKNPFCETYLEANRPAYLAALWAITADWIAAGKPEPSTVLGTFEEWSKVVGGITQHAGFADPCQVVRVAEVDAEGGDARAMMAAIVGGWDNKPAPLDSKQAVSPGDLRKLITDLGLFEGALAGAKTPQAEGSAVGKILSAWSGRDLAGYRLKNDGKPGSRRKYWVEKIEA